MKIQISFLEFKKKIRSKKFRFVLCVSKNSLIADFEIQKKNHNNKSTRTYKKKKRLNKTWQLYIELEIIKTS